MVDYNTDTDIARLFGEITALLDKQGTRHFDSLHGVRTAFTDWLDGLVIDPSITKELETIHDGAYQAALEREAPAPAPPATRKVSRFDLRPGMYMSRPGCSGDEMADYRPIEEVRHHLGSTTVHLDGTRFTDETTLIGDETVAVLVD